MCMLVILGTYYFRMAIAFYCLSTLDVTGMAERQISPTDRKSWKEWIWDQYVGKEFTPSFFLCLVAFGVSPFFLCSPLVLCMCHHRRRLLPRSVCECERR